VHLASASLAYYLAVLLVGMTALLVTEPGARFDQVLFEAVSALSTVGLSMGITAGLSAAGKAAIILLMYVGRVGILSFGIAFAIWGLNRPDAARGDVVL
jgi:trk system potassium uptake protein